MDELMKAILAVFPGASLGEDDGGQILVYTNLMELPQGGFVDMDTLDDWSPPS